MAEDDRSSFRCGDASIDEWFERHAFRNQTLGHSRVFVTELATDQAARPARQASQNAEHNAAQKTAQQAEPPTEPPSGIAGVYALSMHDVAREDAGRVGRGAPREIPVVLIGKLAVHEAHQGVGLGAGLLRDAILRSVAAADAVGAAAILVHTQDPSVVPFYEKYAFERLPGDHASLLLPMSVARATVEAASR